MEHYDYHHLRDEFLGKLNVPTPFIYWLDVREIPPTPFTEVLVTGPTHKHLVAYLDPAQGAWVSQNVKVGFDAYPHWMRLPAPPIYDGDVK